MMIKSHFMHKAHALVLNKNTNDYNYLCNGCKTHGFGKTFRCHQCNFDMHEFCVDCPRHLSSFLHPQHPLDLLIEKSQFVTTCDVCGDFVNGLFYCCKYCNFNVHPICTQFPPFLRHTVHDLHYLAFQKPFMNAACSVCGDVCDSWRYRCGKCDGFDVHVECVTKPYVTTSTFTPAPSNSTYGGSTSRRLPPHAGIHTYAGATPTLTPNYHPNQPNMYGSYPYPYHYHPNQPNMYGSYPYPYHYNPYSYHAGDSEYGQITYGSNMQNHVHNHHIPAQNGQSNSSKWGKIGAAVFSVVTTLTLGVVSNVIFGMSFPGL